MSADIWIIVGGLLFVAVLLLILANRDARTEIVQANAVQRLAKARVRHAWADFVHEHGREPSMPELIAQLYPDDESGDGPENDGPPPPLALREMGLSYEEIKAITEREEA